MYTYIRVWQKPTQYCNYPSVKNKEKKSTTKKLRIMFYSVDFLRTYTQKAVSQISLSHCSEEVSEEDR